MGRGENRSHRMQLDAARQEYERKHTVCDDFVVTGYRAPGGTRGSRERVFPAGARERTQKYWYSTIDWAPFCTLYIP